jgi:hypothetical protein
VPFSDYPNGNAADDWAEACATIDETHGGNGSDPHPDSRLKPLCLHDLFALEIPERKMMLNPIIPEKGLLMLYSTRGVGKTHLVCGVSLAVATGTKFLKWEAERARKVLHIDGEMPAADLRNRFRQIMAGMGVKPEAGMLQILSCDLMDTGIGNFASSKIQQELDPLLDGVELLVLDNLSSLTSVIRDNDAESWNPLQEWLLRLRRTRCIGCHSSPCRERGTATRHKSPRRCLGHLNLITAAKRLSHHRGRKVRGSFREGKGHTRRPGKAV